jgi:hypothetical protein
MSKDARKTMDGGAPVRGRLQEFLDKSRAYAQIPALPRAPDFNLERIAPAPHTGGTDWFYVRDGTERIGLIEDWKKEIEMFRFFPSAENEGRRPEIPEFYDWGALFGARIQAFGTQMLPPLTSCRFDFAKDRGESLILRVEHVHQQDIRGSDEYRLAWHPRLGYTWDCESRYSMPEPARIEFNNLYAGGVSEAREERKRWQKTVRAPADGRISFVYHNPLYTPTDDVHPGGFVGFVTEEDMNPFVEIIEASEPLFMITCSQWYDQHIMMKLPRARAAGGRYCMSARYRFLSLPAAVARELEHVAVMSPPAGRRDVVGFLLDRVNDFERFVPEGEVYNGGVWKGGELSEEHAHSGRRSLKVHGAGPGKLATAAPVSRGPCLVGETGRRYRLSAWVKTELTGGSAFIRVDDVRWSWDDVTASRQSAAATGVRDWTRLSFEFQPGPNNPYLVPRLCVDGIGAAWFDDVAIERIGQVVRTCEPGL